METAQIKIAHIDTVLLFIPEGSPPGFKCKWWLFHFWTFSGCAAKQISAPQFSGLLLLINYFAKMKLSTASSLFVFEEHTRQANTLRDSSSTQVRPEHLLTLQKALHWCSTMVLLVCIFMLAGLHFQQAIMSRWTSEVPIIPRIRSKPLYSLLISCCCFQLDLITSSSLETGAGCDQRCWNREK